MRGRVVRGGAAQARTARGRTIATAVAVAVGLVALAGCSAPGKPDVVASDEGVEPAVIVRAVDNRYEPAEVAIAPGDAVQWVFEGSSEHDVVAEDGSFVSDLVTEGSYTHVFDESGEWAYDCSIHPEMTGVVKVEE